MRNLELRTSANVCIREKSVAEENTIVVVGLRIVGVGYEAVGVGYEAVVVGLRFVGVGYESVGVRLRCVEFRAQRCGLHGHVL